VSLEQFKKQVLLLHSEQRTLDTLSSGFNDRYTVHCATSGSEALNTLGEIQIDVIVSAQTLPGMSGLEALREAKKRSPDTIGILLAGNADDGLEALVGDQEVFQVVRGKVTADSLKTLIDNATRQARLIALAESANDTTANPDEPVGEHIVMETSENGSTIISDGTGRMPALNPKKISAAADVGASSVDVLVLTQDEEFLATVRESARGLHNVIYANTISQADEAIRKHKVGVAVIDAAMVGANVEKLAMHLRSSSPRLVGIVAGRRDDGEMLMDLINRGKVYRFLLKPVSPGRSRLAIEASVKHHLEAPDSAFKIVGGTAAAPPAAAPAPKPQPKPKPKLKPVAAPKPQPAPVQKKPEPARPRPVAKAPGKPKAAPVEKAKIESTSTIVPNRDDALSPIEEGLSNAFGADDTSFTETMTGIVETVTKSLLPKRKDKTAAAEPSADASAMGIEPVAAGSGGSLLGNLKLLGMGAAALIVAAGLGFWLFGGPDEAAVDSTAGEPVAEAPVPAPEEFVFETDVVIPGTLSVDELIDMAQLATKAGQIFSPPGSNAIELYLSALEVAPGDPVAQQGLDAVIEQALGLAESAMLEGRVDDARAALQGIALANPDNSRLPFLNAQVTQMQLRNYMINARAAIRESRFEDAQTEITAAQALVIPDRSEINVVEDELKAALGIQRVDDVIAQANARLEEGNLIAPSNDNARYFFELALRNDPGNTAASQGLVVVASKLVLQAREQIDQGNFDNAEALLSGARRLDPSSGDLAASTAALSGARDRRQQQIRTAADKATADRAAAERAAQERTAANLAAAELATAEQAAAEQAAADRAAADQAAAERRAAEDQAAAEQATSVQQASEELPVQQPAEPVAQGVTEQASAEPVVEEPVVEESVVEEPAANDVHAGVAIAVAGAGDVVEAAAEPVQANVETQQQTAPAPSVINSSPVAVSSLKRTRYVAPKYPRTAQRRGLSGWVDVMFTVDIDGTVTDIEIRDSNPGDTFVKSATNAVEDWEFEPVIENGVAIQERAAVRMLFAIE
jgi:TonB family protein